MKDFLSKLYAYGALHKEKANNADDGKEKNIL